jgi:hypothetical protein
MGKNGIPMAPERLRSSNGRPSTGRGGLIRLWWLEGEVISDRDQQRHAEQSPSGDSGYVG